MENKSILRKILYTFCAVLGGVSFALFFIVTSVYMVAFNRAIYHNSMVRAEAEQYNTHDLTQKELDHVIDDVLKYLVDGRELMDTSVEGYVGELFRDTEISHMVDVKVLFKGLTLIMIVCGVLAPAMPVSMFFLDKKRFRTKRKNFFRWTTIGTAVFIGAVLIMILIDFDWAFTQFHYLLFTNLDWQLYSSDLLIEMLPADLFMRLGIYISVTFAALMAAFFLIGIYFDKIVKLFRKNPPIKISE